MELRFVKPQGYENNTLPLTEKDSISGSGRKIDYKIPPGHEMQNS
jgi:hypothetical protein